MRLELETGDGARRTGNEYRVSVLNYLLKADDAKSAKSSEPHARCEGEAG